MSVFKVNEAKFDSEGNIVIQDVTNSTITIHLGNEEEVRHFLAGISDKLNELPLKVLKALSMVEILEDNLKGLNVYLTTLINLNQSGNPVSLSFGLAITNLNKTIRYINTPYFKVEPEFVLANGLRHDTFQLIAPTNSQFPVRLEFGEVKQIVYEINKNQMDLFIQNNQPSATIKAFVSTTVGELFHSDDYSIEKLVSTHLNIIK